MNVSNSASLFRNRLFTNKLTLELDILFLGLAKKKMRSRSLLAQSSNSFSLKLGCFVWFSFFPEQSHSFVRLYSIINLTGVLVEIMLHIVLQE